jgi:hypothetical protein
MRIVQNVDPLKLSVLKHMKIAGMSRFVCTCGKQNCFLFEKKRVAFVSVSSFLAYVFCMD